MSLGILIFVAALLIVIMVHEAGHFFVAKAFDFKATQFFLGFGPTLWSFRRGETEYGVKALPLGGFVKIVGMNPYEDVAPEDEPRSYPNKPRWQRALVLIAGPATHFVVAFVMLFVTAVTLGFPTGDVTTTVDAITTRLDGEATPAAEVDLRPGDRIVSIDHRPVTTWGRVSDYIKAHPGKNVTLEIERDGSSRVLTTRLGAAIFAPSGKVLDFSTDSAGLRELRAGEKKGGFLGLMPQDEYERDSPLGAVATAGSGVAFYTKGSIAGVPQVFAPIFNGDLWETLRGERERTTRDPVGLVGAGRLAGETVRAGRYWTLIQMIVWFTVFVGIMNLIPLPPLDGGHLAAVGWEAVTGKQVDVRKLIPLAAAVISFFVILFLAVLYLDLANPLRLNL